MQDRSAAYKAKMDVQYRPFITALGLPGSKNMKTATACVTPTSIEMMSFEKAWVQGSLMTASVKSGFLATRAGLTDYIRSDRYVSRGKIPLVQRTTDPQQRRRADVRERGQ